VGKRGQTMLLRFKKKNFEKSEIFDFRKFSNFFENSYLKNWTWAKKTNWWANMGKKWANDSSFQISKIRFFRPQLLWASFRVLHAPSAALHIPHIVFLYPLKELYRSGGEAFTIDKKLI